MKSSRMIVVVLLSNLLSLSYVYAQKDTLFLYTKPDCSNCQATKQVFKQLGIKYFEKDLNNSTNASEMLHKLALLGYKDKIFLPVIFLNKSIFHPAFNTKKGLVSINIEAAIDSMKIRYFKGDLQLYGNDPSMIENSNIQQTSTSDCELETKQYYLICANYNTEKEGAEAMKKLIANGYSYAGVIFIGNRYLVYNKFFLDKNIANQQLEETRKIFSSAYVLEN